VRASSIPSLEGQGSVPELKSKQETEPRSSKPGSKRYSDKVRGISQTVAYKGLLLKTQHPQISNLKPQFSRVPGCDRRMIRTPQLITRHLFIGIPGADIELGASRLSEIWRLVLGIWAWWPFGQHALQGYGSVSNISTASLRNPVRNVD